MGLFDKKKQIPEINQPRIANPAPTDNMEMTKIDQARIQLEAYRKQLDDYRKQLESMAVSLREREQMIEKKEKELGLR